MDMLANPFKNTLGQIYSLSIWEEESLNIVCATCLVIILLHFSMSDVTVHVQETIIQLNESFLILTGWGSILFFCIKYSRFTGVGGVANFIPCV